MLAAEVFQSVDSRLLKLGSAVVLGGVLMSGCGGASADSQELPVGEHTNTVIEPDTEPNQVVGPEQIGEVFTKKSATLRTDVDGDLCGPEVSSFILNNWSQSAVCQYGGFKGQGKKMIAEYTAPDKGTDGISVFGFIKDEAEIQQGLEQFKAPNPYLTLTEVGGLFTTILDNEDSSVYKTLFSDGFSGIDLKKNIFSDEQIDELLVIVANESSKPL